MTAVLVCLDDGSDISINKPIVVVGRSDDCDVVVDSKKVSRQHCVIARINNRLVIRDLGSTNGIRVNGQRTEESPLEDNDQVVLGNIRFQVRYLPSASNVVKPGNLAAQAPIVRSGQTADPGTGPRPVSEPVGPATAPATKPTGDPGRPAPRAADPSIYAKVEDFPIRLADEAPIPLASGPVKALGEEDSFFGTPMVQLPASEPASPKPSKPFDRTLTDDEPSQESWLKIPENIHFVDDGENDPPRRRR